MGIILKKTIKIPLYLLGDIIYFISKFIPRHKNIWIFGSWLGDKFADNSKYLFLYITKNHPEIRAIWFTNSKSVFNYLKRQKYEVIKMHSFKAFMLVLMSSCVISSTGLADVLSGMSRFVRVRAIELWHGTPLKKLEGPTNHSYKSILSKFINNLYEFWYKIFPFTKQCDMVIATSDLSKESMALALNVDRKKVLVTGYPRNDIFFNNSGANFNKFKLNLREKIDFKYIFIYLPTFRSQENKQEDYLFTKYGFSPIVFQHLLEDLNAIFIFKCHYYHKRLNLSLNNNGEISQRIYNLSDEDFPDIYPILKETNILITDYSSVYFDYLLLNRPIIFTPFDLKEFVSTEREFFYNYNDVTPGPKAKNWNEVLIYIKDSIKYPKKYELERKRVCNMFNTYHDADNSRRVFEAIVEELKI